jgi:hypothetical protein
MCVVCTRSKTVFANFPASSLLPASEKPVARQEHERAPVLPAAEMALNRIATLFVSRFSSIA